MSDAKKTRVTLVLEKAIQCLGKKHRAARMSTYDIGLEQGYKKSVEILEKFWLLEQRGQLTDEFLESEDAST